MTLKTRAMPIQITCELITGSPVPPYGKGREPSLSTFLRRVQLHDPVYLT